MFTKFEQIEDWVRDFGLVRWEFSSKQNFEDMICRSDWFEDCSTEEKLDRCRKYVEDCGRKLYGRGYKGTSPNSPAIMCEVQICATQPQAVAPVGYMPAPAPAFDEKAFEARLRKEIAADYEKKDLERREKELAEEMREFRRDKESALGIMVGYLKPLLGTAASAVAGAARPAAIHGVDAPEDVDAPKIEPVGEEDNEESPFSDEESDQLFSLLARFKKVEPNYLTMIARVVEMAEAGDSTYTMARGILCK